MFLLIFFVFIVSLVSVPHLGGKGIELPNNFSIWFLAAVFVLVSLWRVLDRSEFYVKKTFLIFVIILWITFFASLTYTQLSLSEISYYFYAFLITSLFPLAVLQWRVSHSDFHLILKVVITIGLFHAIISIIQVHDQLKIWYSFTGYAPLDCNCKAPIGVIQQVNMHSSFMSLVVISAVYLMSYKGYWTYPAIMRWLILISATLSLYSLLLGSSRAGFLGLVLGLALLMCSSDKSVLKNKDYILLLLSMLLVSLLLNYYFPNDAAGTLIQKSERMFLGFDVRTDIYLTTIRMISENPVLGYGLGAFHDEFYSYIGNHVEMFSESNYAALKKISHPHNELLLWAFNAGGVFIIGFVAFVYAYFTAVIWRKWRMFLTIVSISLPLIIQALVSLPFFMSSLHLFSLMFLMVYALKGSKKRVVKFLISGLLVKFMKVMIILSLLLLTYTYLEQILLVWSSHDLYEEETNRLLINQLKNL